MSDQMITCPHCNQTFPITQAIDHQIREELEVTIRQELEAAKLKEVNDFKRRLEEQQKEAADATQEELDTLRGKLEDTKNKLKESQDNELKVRKEREHLENEKSDWELEKQRQIDAERKQIQEKIEARFQQEQELKDRYKDELITGLQKNIDELQQKIEQGSQQMQGEVLELVLEDLLRAKFPFDEITPVPKGINGGDIIQTVRDDNGKQCGTILWEMKRTKNWGNDWCEKLRKDQSSARAEISILVSNVLPKSIKSFGHFEGIWVTEQSYAHGLATALRSGLIQISSNKRSSENRSTKMEKLYDYLSGTEFQHQIEIVVRSFQIMKTELESEKNSMKRIWSKREKQIEHITDTTLDIIGAIQGISGDPLAHMDNLDLQALTAGESVEEAEIA